MLQWEKQINSVQELIEEWKNLEQDGGIRINRDSPNLPDKNTIFLFFYEGIYWINLSGNKESYLQFTNFGLASNKLLELLKEPFKAWVY